MEGLSRKENIVILPLLLLQAATIITPFTPEEVIIHARECHLIADDFDANGPAGTYYRTVIQRYNLNTPEKQQAYIRECQLYNIGRHVGSLQGREEGPETPSPRAPNDTTGI